MAENRKIIISLILLILFSACQTFQKKLESRAFLGASWTAPVAVDQEGNVITAGYIMGTVPLSFGKGVSLKPQNAEGAAFIVKYSSEGKILWMRDVKSAKHCYFYSLAADEENNIYASGYIEDMGINFFGKNPEGKEITAAGIVKGDTALIVKYNSQGQPLWAKTPSSGPGTSYIYGICVDKNGDLFAAGTLQHSGSYDLGQEIKLWVDSPDTSCVLIKVDKSGNTLWARTGYGKASSFMSCAADSEGNIYACGKIYQSDSYTFSSNMQKESNSSNQKAVIVKGSSEKDFNVLLIKYDSQGTVLWARSALFGLNDSFFYFMAVSPSDNPVITGFFYGNGVYSFGMDPEGKEITISNPCKDSSNVAIVSYDKSGNPLWTGTVTRESDPIPYDKITRQKNSTAVPVAWSKGLQAADYLNNEICASDYNSISISNEGKIYAAGNIFGFCGFGNNVFLKGPAEKENNLALVKYSAEGSALWAKSVLQGIDATFCYGSAVDSKGNIFAAGQIWGTGIYSFSGNQEKAVSVQGSCPNNYNFIIIKFDPDGKALWAHTASE